ncbi:hypothetical protein BV25DRAFT_1091381 [Artomyces pyxidatus]|uniref:Uncharacterized protein n=1 Tax=Artomyces pyxidatus TaxID=48021 RepID=A0ACB8TFX6_9AGAM|nr:hypothetical protein BV25DRAFT_1091381 [Artomyces pyxidatus]
MAQSSVEAPQHRPDQVMHVRSDLHTPLPRLLVVEQPKAPLPARQVSHTVKPGALPSPHELRLKRDIYPVVSVEMSQGKEQRTRRKRRRQNSNARPQATFWQPLRALGGKSSGYAMGYEGSWPVDEEMHSWPRCYVRDRMKKAELAI